MIMDKPDIQVSVFLNDEFNSPRNTCMYRKAKNIEAILECAARVIEPPDTFRVDKIVDSKALSSLALKCIANITPVIICTIRAIPNIDPMFHIYEIEDGVGRLIRLFLMISANGFFCFIWVFIYLIVFRVFIYLTVILIIGIKMIIKVVVIRRIVCLLMLKIDWNPSLDFFFMANSVKITKLRTIILFFTFSLFFLFSCSVIEIVNT